MSEYRRIHRDDIRAHLAAGTPMQIVETLPEKYYKKAHLPGAVNLPHDQVRERAAALLPDKEAFIVVYCASTPCENSRIAAETLASLGYANVAEYVEGKQDWIDAGLPVEGAREAA